MQKFLILILALALTVFLSCGSDMDESAKGAGGPDSSPIELGGDGDNTPKEPAPAQPADEGDVTTPAGETEEIAGNEVIDGEIIIPVTDVGSGSSGESGDSGDTGDTDDTDDTGDAGDTGDTGDAVGAGDSGDSSDDGDSPGEDIIPDDEADVDDAEAAKGVRIALDTSQGKWFVAERKELFSKADFQAANAQIKDLRAKIREMRSEIRGLQKTLPEQASDKAKEKTSANKSARIDQIKSEIDVLRARIKSLRDANGVNRFQDGIWTAWANQDLYLNVNVDKAGWYRLRVVAKNIHGPLPDFYSHFNVSLSNESTGTHVGGAVIKASDRINQASGVWVYLNEGASRLKLLWTNDAYKQGEYDANINIRRIALTYRGQNAPNMGMRRGAHKYSYVDGRFFWDHNSVWTNWANQCIGFDYTNLKAGKYRVIVSAKNRGVVPAEYRNFRVRVNTDDGAEAFIDIPANADRYQKGDVVLDITGPTSIYLTWTNDMYKPDQNPVEDANIQYRSIRLQRIGESERSRVAAYLLGTRSGNMVITFGTLAMLGMILAGLYFVNRRRSRYVS